MISVSRVLARNEKLPTFWWPLTPHNPENPEDTPKEIIKMGK